MRSIRWTFVLASVILAPSQLLPQAPPVRLNAGACQWEREANAAWGYRVLGVSSEDGGSAKRATGRPDVFPTWGPGSFGTDAGYFGGGGEGSVPSLRTSAAAPARVWSPRQSENRPEWIKLSFRRPVRASELWVFVTGGAGAEMRIFVVNPDGSITPAAQLPPERWSHQAAQIVVPLDTARLVSGIRVEVEPTSVEETVWLDAVAAVPRPVCVPGAPAPSALPARGQGGP